jgi:hypothetical protein
MSSEYSSDESLLKKTNSAVFLNSLGEGTPRKVATAKQPQFPRKIADFKQATSFQISRCKLRKLTFD